jgi:hypothetical protein
MVPTIRYQKVDVVVIGTLETTVGWSVTVLREELMTWLALAP